MTTQISFADVAVGFPHILDDVVVALDNPSQLARTCRAFHDAAASPSLRASWLLARTSGTVRSASAQDATNDKKADSRRILQDAFVLGVRTRILDRAVWTAFLHATIGHAPPTLSDTDKECSHNSNISHATDVLVMSESVSSPEILAIALTYRLLSDPTTVLAALVGSGHADVVAAAFISVAADRARSTDMSEHFRMRLRIQSPVLDSTLNALDSNTALHADTALALTDAQMIAADTTLVPWCMSSKQGLALLNDIATGKRGSSTTRHIVIGTITASAPKLIVDAVLRNDTDAVATIASIASMNTRLDVSKAMQAAKTAGHKECARILQAIA